MLFVLIRNNQIRVYSLYEPQSITIRASSQRVVEGKHPRLQFFNADAVIRAGQTGAEGLFFHGHPSLSTMTCTSPSPWAIASSHASERRLCDTIFHFDPVYDDLYGMFESLFQLDLIFFQKAASPRRPGHA